MGKLAREDGVGLGGLALEEQDHYLTRAKRGEDPAGVGDGRAAACYQRPARRTAEKPALLLRSGRRWRAAPDEGASAASCSCLTPTRSKRQKQRGASRAHPHPDRKSTRLNSSH